MTPDRQPEPGKAAERQSRRAPGHGEEEGLKSQVWVVGLVGIVVIMLALLSLVL